MQWSLSRDIRAELLPEREGADLYKQLASAVQRQYEVACQNEARVCDPQALQSESTVKQPQGKLESKVSKGLNGGGHVNGAQLNLPAAEHSDAKSGGGNASTSPPLSQVGPTLLIRCRCDLDDIFVFVVQNSIGEMLYLYAEALLYGGTPLGVHKRKAKLLLELAAAVGHPTAMGMKKCAKEE
jgi:hypothetical protein